MKTNKNTNTMSERKIKSHYYIFLGRKYNTRKECKEAIERRGKRVRVTNSYFNTLLDLRIVREFRD